MPSIEESNQEGFRAAQQAQEQARVEQQNATAQADQQAAQQRVEQQAANARQGNG